MTFRVTSLPQLGETLSAVPEKYKKNFLKKSLYFYLLMELRKSQICRKKNKLNFRKLFTLLVVCLRVKCTYGTSCLWSQALQSLANSNNPMKEVQFSLFLTKSSEHKLKGSLIRIGSSSQFLTLPIIKTLLNNKNPIYSYYIQISRDVLNRSQRAFLFSKASILLKISNCI